MIIRLENAFAKKDFISINPMKLASENAEMESQLSCKTAMTVTLSMAMAAMISVRANKILFAQKTTPQKLPVFSLKTFSLHLTTF